MTDPVNDHLVLITGESGTGKSVSLMNLPDHDKKMYLNCEAGKRLPFKNKFKAATVTDPYQVSGAFDHALNNPDYDTIIIDTFSFLMDMYESIYVIPSTNGQQAWGNYAQFVKTIMQDKVANSDKSVIILSHVVSELDEKSMSIKTRASVKGAVGKGNGLESYFSTVVSTKKMSLKDLEPYRDGNDLLIVTPQDEALGFKHVFQTQVTKTTLGERMRAPIGMFSHAETFIDNDAGKLLGRLNEYYA